MQRQAEDMSIYQMEKSAAPLHWAVFLVTVLATLILTIQGGA